MHKEEVNSHVQVLLRNVNETRTDAVSAFFSHKEQHELYPDVVETTKGGTWNLSEKGSSRQLDGKYKVWAVYMRELEVNEETPEELISQWLREEHL